MLYEGGGYLCSMAITNERLQEFMRLYEEELGGQIDEDEAREIASRLIELYAMLAEPLPSELAHTVTPQPAADQEKDHRSVPIH